MQIQILSKQKGSFYIRFLDGEHIPNSIRFIVIVNELYMANTNVWC